MKMKNLIEENNISKILKEASDSSGVISELKKHNLSTNHLCSAIIAVKKNKNERIRKPLRIALRDILSESNKLLLENNEDWMNVLNERSVVLEELKLDNFRSFKSGTIISPENNDCTFIMAPNGHGKTTLISALRFLIRGSMANDSNASSYTQSKFLWDSIPIDHRSMSRPEVKVIGKFVIDGTNIEIERIIQSRRMYPDSGKDLVEHVGVTVDGKRASKPRELIKQYFGESVLLDYHVFDAEESRVLFTGNNDDESGITIFNSKQNIQSSLKEFIGLSIIDIFQKDLKKLIAEIREEYRYTNGNNLDWIEFDANCKILEDAIDLEIKNLDELKNKHESYIEEDEKMRKLLEGAEEALQLLLEEDKIREEHEEIDNLMSEVIDEINNSMPWLHLIVGSDNLHELGNRHSSSETRRIVNDILHKAPLKDLVELTSWLENYRDNHSGPLGARDLIGSPGWENISKALLKLPSLRIGDNWIKLNKTRQKQVKLNNKRDKLNSAWEKLPDLKIGAKETLRNLGIKRNELNQEIGKIKLIISQKELYLESKNTELSLLKRNPPVGENAGEKAELIRNEIEKLEALYSVLTKFNNSVIESMRILVEKSSSSIFSKMMRKERRGLVISNSYKFKVIESESGKIMPLPSAGEETLAVLSFLLGLQEVTGIKLPLIIDSGFHRLDLHHQSILLSYLCNEERQTIVFLTEKDWSSMDESDKRKILAKELICLRGPEEEERFIKIDDLNLVSKFISKYKSQKMSHVTKI